jgi:hypothetical protein
MTSDAYKRIAYWHGGPRIVGDLILDSGGAGRSGDTGVYVTTDRSLAEIYASTVVGPAWVYEVEPLTEPVPVPSLVGGPTISYRCEGARIVRRFTLSNANRAANQAAVAGGGLPSAWTIDARGNMWRKRP